MTTTTHQPTLRTMHQSIKDTHTKTKKKKNKIASESTNKHTSIKSILKDTNPINHKTTQHAQHNNTLHRQTQAQQQGKHK